MAWRALLALGVALLATGVVLMHSVGPQTGAPGHGGHVAMSHDMGSHGTISTGMVSTGTVVAAVAGQLAAGPAGHHGTGGVCLAVLPGLLGLALLALSRLRRRAGHLPARPRATRRLVPPRAPPRPVALTLTRLCVLRT